jgi:predicted dehydrogenase
MNLFVIGCGSIGERHIRNLTNMYHDFQIIATDTSTERLTLMKRKYHIKPCKTLEDGFKNEIDAAIVCTPPSSHIPIARMAIEKGAHVFIEKPLSNSLSNVEELLEKSRSANLIIFVGYCFRFHPGLRIMKEVLDSGDVGKVLLAQAEYGQYLPDWRPWQDYKQSYTAKKELGGGIILDGSHEIDYLRWLVGDITEVFSFAGKLSDLDVETEDAAGILLRFVKDAIGIIRLDFVRKDYSRSCELICQEGTIKWNFQDNLVKVFNRDKGWKVHRNLIADTNDIYIAEMKHFIACTLGKEVPLINGEEGLKALRIALAAKESAEKGNVVRI